MRKKDMKKKDVMMKMKLWRKQLLQKRISPVCGMGNGCEAKMRMLRKNNRCLARALSDQKIEANHWYTEAITLKGELQELQEKLLRMPDSNMHVENVFVEAEKQIKECYESIDKDFNSALDRIVQAVEKLTKVKQLVGGIHNILQGSCQGPSNIFSRTPGSRILLRANGSSPSPRQRAVPPMVSGHVLQPVMVPLPKLKIDWNDRKRNHFLVNGENGLNMSTIGEQSSPENSEVSVVSEEQQSLDAEEDHQLQNDGMTTSDDNMLGSQSQNELDAANPQIRLDESTSRRYSLRCNSDSSPEPQAIRAIGVKLRTRRQIQSRRVAGRGSGRIWSSSSRISVSSSTEASEHLAEEKEVHTTTPNGEDPLEGPSWLLDEGRSRACRSKFRGEREKAHKQKCAKTDGDAATMNSDDADGSVDFSPKLRQGGFQESRSRKKVSSPTITPKDSPSQSLDQSCLDSPTSMLARLEMLEAVGGRKSKRFLKKKKYFGNSKNLEAKAEDTSLSLQEDKQLGRSTMPSTEKIVLEFCTPRKIGARVDSVTENNKEEPCNTSSALISESPVVFREDNDLTCKIVTNMDITLPVSNSIIEENPATSTENSLQDESKSTQSKKKFFKTREIALCEEIPEKVERTPFDLSMLNESVVKMPPFSSTRTTEKENLPPLSAENCSESVSLRDVSIVLEDVMKQPAHEETPNLSLMQKESQSAKCISSHTPRKLRSLTRRTLQYTVNYREDTEEIKKPKRSRKTIKKGEKEHSLKTVDVLVESTPNQELKSLKKSAKKTLDTPEDSHIELKESRGKKTGVLLSDNIEMKEGLNRCFVMVHRTPLKGCLTTAVDDNRTPRRNIMNDLSVLSDLNQHQQASEDEKNPQGQVEEVEATSGASTDTQSNSYNNNTVNTQRDINHVEKKNEYEENTQTGIESDESEDDCILLDIENPCDKKQIQQENMSNAEEHPSEDCSRKRRAALRISSFKEVSLHRKMRRGENDTIVITDSEVKGRSRSRARGRGRGRGKSSNEGKDVEKEAFP